MWLDVHFQRNLKKKVGHFRRFLLLRVTCVRLLFRADYPMTRTSEQEITKLYEAREQERGRGEGARGYRIYPLSDSEPRPGFRTALPPRP